MEIEGKVIGGRETGTTLFENQRTARFGMRRLSSTEEAETKGLATRRVGGATTSRIVRRHGMHQDLACQSPVPQAQLLPAAEIDYLMHLGGTTK